MKITDDDIIKQGYFDCRICSERHMAMVPFKVLDNGNVICAYHTADGKNPKTNVQESKRKVEESIFALVRWLECEYDVSVKTVKLQHKGLGGECTGVEVVAII